MQDFSISLDIVRFSWRLSPLRRRWSVFAQVPALRPVGVVRCAAHREVDVAGTPYIRISLANAVPVRRTSRSGKSAAELIAPA